MKDLFNKPVQDLTVADSLKINAVVLAGMAGAAAVLIGGGAAIDRLKRARHNKTRNVESTD